MKRSRVNGDIQAGVVLAATFAFMMALFEPLCLFFLNKNEYIFDVYELLPILVEVFLLLLVIEVIVVVVVATILPKLFFGMMTIYMAIFICLYVQGNFFAGELPELNGSYIEWERYGKQYLQSTILWIGICIVVFVVAFKVKRDRFLKGVKYLSSIMLMMFIVTVAVTGVVNKGFEKKLDLMATSENVMEYSSDKNYIIIVMDCTDAEYERIVLEKYPEYKECFKDFTYYDNVVGSYTVTEYALPFIMGGERYTAQREWEDYARDAYLKSPLIQRLKEDGYRLGLYTDQVNLDSWDFQMYDNILRQKGQLEDKVSFAKVWMRLVCYKYAPYFLKRYTQVDPIEFKIHFKNKEGIRRWIFEDTNIPFRQECTNLTMNVEIQKCFKLIHLSGAHSPFQFLPDATETTYSSYEDNVAAVNTLFKYYVERLKQDGIYDNSVIIVMADHGIAGDLLSLQSGREDPILFIKGFNETHDEMQISEAPISMEDYQDAYFKLLDGAIGEQVFNSKEGDVRTRRILRLEDALVEYETTRSNSDVEGFRATGNKYKINSK